MTNAAHADPPHPAPQDQPAVLTERRGHVLVVTLNRPEARNAVNLAVTTGVGDALEEAEHDRGIWAVIVTGAGDKAFCAGADLKAVSRGESLAPEDPVRAAWGFAGYVTHHISKPTIAQNGTSLTIRRILNVVRARYCRNAVPGPNTWRILGNCTATKERFLSRPAASSWRARAARFP